MPLKRVGRETDFKQKKCQIPGNCSANSTLCQVSGLEHLESSKHQGFFLPASPKTSQQSCPPRLWGGLIGWQGSYEMAMGLCRLVGANGLLPRSGLFSVWDRGGTSPSSMCGKIIWAIAFLPTLSAAKLRKKRKRKESCSEMGQRELVHMENKSHCKTAVGNDFSCCGICPPILSNCTYSCVSTCSCTLPPLAWHSVTVTMHALCVQGAGRQTRCCCHVLPATSIQAAQPFLVCHFVIWNVQQLAAQTSVSWFLLFLSYIIHFSYLY